MFFSFFSVSYLIYMTSITCYADFVHFGWFLHFCDDFRYDKNKKNTELLVGFHRTLLRRYATLEYELCDANDKLKVRSERIKDLENDYKKLKHNAKLKAKLHLTDMVRLSMNVICCLKVFVAY